MKKNKIRCASRIAFGGRIKSKSRIFILPLRSSDPASAADLVKLLLKCDLWVKVWDAGDIGGVRVSGRSMGSPFTRPSIFFVQYKAIFLVCKI
jgi:hypothetical protein